MNRIILFWASFLFHIVMNRIMLFSASFLFHIVMNRIILFWAKHTEFERSPPVSSRSLFNRWNSKKHNIFGSKRRRDEEWENRIPLDTHEEGAITSSRVIHNGRGRRETAAASLIKQWGPMELTSEGHPAVDSCSLQLEIEDSRIV